MRDTADKVKVAEKIIEANDKAKAEVVVDVELLQIDYDAAARPRRRSSTYSGIRSSTRSTGIGATTSRRRRSRRSASTSSS